MLKKHNIKEGFTIIEVIIVLVIAAVIMLAVFLVVPQLQRSAANNAFQTNARSALTAAQQWIANNPGTTAPTSQNIKDITGQFKDASGTAKDPAVVTAPATPAPGIVNIVANATCKNSNPQSGGTANLTTATGNNNNSNMAVVVGLSTSASAPATGSNSYYCINN